MRAVDVSVIVATRDRSAQLSDLLRDLQLQSTRASCEVVVIDNGSNGATQRLLQQYESRLRLRTLREPIPGKSLALNRALAAAEGSLFAFTDDDVRVPPHWLEQLHDAAQTDPGSDVFCGPVIPICNSRAMPQWLKRCAYAAPMLAMFTPPAPRGPLPPPAVPLGPNVAVRRMTAIKHSFRADLGPGEQGPYLCEDTAFILACLEAGRPHFVPAASVLHTTRPTLLEFDSMKDRAFWLGRSRVRMAHHGSAPNDVPRAWSQWCDDPPAYFDAVMSLNEWYGCIAEFADKGMHSAAAGVYETLCRYAPRNRTALLGERARRVSRAYGPGHHRNSGSSSLRPSLY